MLIGLEHYWKAVTVGKLKELLAQIPDDWWIHAAQTGTGELVAIPPDIHEAVVSGQRTTTYHPRNKIVSISAEGINE